MNGKRVFKSPVRSQAAATGCLIVGLLAMVLWAVPGEATVIKGSLRTSTYTREVPDAEGQLSTRADVLQNIRFDVLQLGARSFSLHTSLTARDAFGGEDVDGRTRLYHGYLKFAPRTPHLGGLWDARVGRQWVSAGVGTGTVDGVSVRLTKGRVAEVCGFFGTLGIEQSNGIYLDSTDDSARYGGRVRLSRSIGSLHPVLAVSYEQSRRRTLDDSERLGIHASVRIPRGIRLYGDWRRDLIGKRTIRFTGGIEHTTDSRSRHTWLEYSERHPYFRASSIFWSFFGSSVSTVRGGLRVRAWDTWQMILDGDLVEFDDGERERGVRFMLGNGGISVGWRIHRGWGGDFSGLVVAGHRSLGERLTLDANLNLSRQRYGEVEEVEEDQSQHILALRYRLRDTLTLIGQVEGLTNEGFEYDTRFLGMIQWRFRHVLGAREDQR